MDRKPTPSADHEAHTVRIAWWVSFLATIALIAILGIAKSAQAATLAAPSDRGTATANHFPVEELTAEEEFEGEFEGEECEEGEEECEEEGGAEAPLECVLSSAQATVFASSPSDKIHLLIRYAAASPSLVAVAFGLHGSKGSLYLGQSKRHFGRTGVFSQAETLSEPQMARALGATDFAVQLYAVDAPRYCRHFFEPQLTIRHAAPGGLIWSEAESDLRR